jgi:drug/metabolite transporter (DMT)-like permease
MLTSRGEKSSVINFYSYLGLTTIGFIISIKPVFQMDLLQPILIMGFLGSLANYFIIKALSCGELSTLAPINSYKPLIALFVGIMLLNEIPGLFELFGILFIILGTILLGKSNKFFSKATFYRFLALIFSGTEAIFIKKIIILSDLPSSFLYWALASLIFTFIFALTSKHVIKIQKQNVKLLLVLILLVTAMQYSTNYVFSKMNVANALALFQLSTLVSIFLGAKVFNEKGLLKKVLASFIMLLGATIIILC